MLNMMEIIFICCQVQDSNYQRPASPPVARQIMSTADRKQLVTNAGGFLAIVFLLLLTMAMSLFLLPLLSLVVFEKEKRIKESLKMIGLHDSVFWLSWFLIYAASTLLTSAILAVLVNLLLFDELQAIWLVFLIMYLFSLSMIMLAFLLTTMFNKVKSATMEGICFITITSILAIFQDRFRENVTALWILSLLSPSAFALAMNMVRINRM